MAKQSRPTAAVRRSPRAARPDHTTALHRSPRAARTAVAAGRPVPVPFAAVFGGLAAAELLYLAWLLVDPDAGFDSVPGWPVAVLVGLAGWALVGAVLVVLGRARGWLVLVSGSVVALLVLLAVAVLFLALGAGRQTWWAVVMLIGPAGALVLAAQRPVRQWTSR